MLKNDYEIAMETVQYIKNYDIDWLKQRTELNDSTIYACNIHSLPDQIKNIFNKKHIVAIIVQKNIDILDANIKFIGEYNGVPVVALY